MIPRYKVTFCSKPGECKPPVLGWSETGILQAIKKPTVDDQLTLVVRLEDYHSPSGYVDVEIETGRLASVIPIEEIP